MTNEVKLKKDEGTIDEESFLGKLIAGTKGKVKIKTPFGIREVKKVKDSKGKAVKKLK